MLKTGKDRFNRYCWFISSRADFYEKEISFQVSCSYGPGRYDKNYEEEGQDYPIDFVRWSAQRNFEAVLDLMATGGLDIAPLITHYFSIDDGHHAIELLTSDAPALGILIHYPNPPQSINQSSRNIVLAPQKNPTLQRYFRCVRCRKLCSSASHSSLPIRPC